MPSPNTAAQRSFGFIVGAGFAIIGLWPVILRADPPRTIALAISMTLIVLALVYPAALTPAQRAWMVIGEALGWVNTRIILGVIYYGLFVPIGLVRRRVGVDPMRRALAPEAETYKIARLKRDPAHVRRQY